MSEMRPQTVGLRMASLQAGLMARLHNRRFLRHSGLLMLANIITTALGLVRTLAVTWLIPREQVGMLGVLAAWTPFLSLLSLPGIDAAAYHYVAKGQNWAFRSGMLTRLRWSVVERDRLSSALGPRHLSSDLSAMPSHTHRSAIGVSLSLPVSFRLAGHRILYSIISSSRIRAHGLTGIGSGVLYRSTIWNVKRIWDTWSRRALEMLLTGEDDHADLMARVIAAEPGSRLCSGHGVAGLARSAEGLSFAICLAGPGLRRSPSPSRCSSTIGGPAVKRWKAYVVVASRG